MTATYLSTQGQRLAREAAEAAEVRDMLTHPDVVALRVDKVRALADRLIWVGIVIGLLFTLINVQTFAAQRAAALSLPWWGAWFLDPAVSVILLGVLIADSVISQWQIETGWRVHVAKWLLLAATYTMNTWDAWATHWWAGAALHSVPPLAVFAAAECRTAIQDKLSACIHKAHAYASRRAEEKAAADLARQAREQERRDEQARADLGKDRRAEMERLLHDAEVAAAQSRINALAAPAATAAVEPAVEPAVATAQVGGRQPRPKTGKTRGRKPALDLAVLVRHAQPLLDQTPELGSRELANQLGVAMNIEVPRYWAQKAKDKVTEEAAERAPLHAVAR